MNLLLEIVLSAALVAPAGRTSIEPDSGVVAFTSAGAWLRTSPGARSRLVAWLPKGARVQVIGCRKQDCSVQYRRLQGYVTRDLLRATPDTSRTETSMPILSPEEKLALLMDEHRLSTQISIDLDSDDDSVLVPAGYQQR